MPCLHIGAGIEYLLQVVYVSGVSMDIEKQEKIVVLMQKRPMEYILNADNALLL